MAELAMFPLGSVLFPSLLLPLHVFEPRYRALVRDCLDGDRELGMVLIERGSEVGGGDVRTDVGCRGRIVEAVEMEDGRWALGVLGTERLRVTEWLADDPYPRAEVEPWDDEGPGGDALEGRYVEAVGALRKVLGLRSEMGASGPPATSEVSDDPILGSYQVAALAPMGPMDQQRALAAPGPLARLDLVVDWLDEEAAVLSRRLEME
jgi:Lon protease-like protein